MSAATQEPFRLFHGTRQTPARASSRRLGIGIVGAVVVAMVLAVVSSLSSERRGLSGVPTEERAALLSRTVTELRQFCGPGHPAALDDHCRELATFAARFEECRSECEALVRPFLTPNPTR